MLNKNISITAFPRIHITLIGMNANGHRINGGAGFAINNPELNFVFKKSEHFIFEDNRTCGFSINEKERLKRRIDKIKAEFSLNENIKCSLESEAPPHSGLGTSTITYLACIEALLKLNNYEYTEDLVRNISGRGGTSGIGIYSYFNGGFFLDIGRKRDSLENKFAPSSITENRRDLPLKLLESKMPEWEIFIFIPNFGFKSEEEEIRFFNSACPIKSAETSEILYECIYGIAASIIEEDITTFGEAINNIQIKEWKQKETSLYQYNVQNLAQKLIEKGANYVGMSSLGPSIYFSVKDNNVKPTILDYLKNKGILIQTKPNNTGRIIRYE